MMEITTKIELTWEDIATCIANEMREEGWIVDKKSMKYAVASKTFEGVTISINAAPKK